MIGYIAWTLLSLWYVVEPQIVANIKQVGSPTDKALERLQEINAAFCEWDIMKN